MVTPNQLKAWDPGRLEEISDDLVGHRRALLNQSDELAAGRVPASWTMESAIAAQRSYQQLADALATQVAEVAAVINALDAAATAIRAAKRDLTGAYYAAASNDLRIDGATGAVRMTRQYETSQDAAHAAIQQNYVTAQVEDALAAAERADQALAAALRTAVTKDTNTIGTLDQQREITQFVEMSTTAQVDYLLEHPEAYALLDGYVSDEVKEQLGRAVAAELGRAARDPDAFADAATVERCSELLGAFGSDPVIMARTYEDLGPDGLVGTFTQLESTMFTGAGAEELAVLAGQLRTGLQSATLDEGFDAEGFGEDLVRYATSDLSGAERAAYTQAYGTDANKTAAMLDYLLREGDYGEDFVRGVAWQLDEFERANPGDAALWRENESFGSPLNGLDGHDHTYQPDPMAQVMGQLGKHPELGLEFFSDGEDAEARKDYYFAERDWTRDNFAGISEMALAVGTDPDNMASSHHDTSLFVSEFFTRIADNPGFTPHLATAGSESVGQLLGAYMPSVQSAIAYGSTAMTSGDLVEVAVFGGELVGLPMVDREHLESLMQVALSTPGGSERIAEGIANYRQGELQAFARSGEVMVQGQVNEELQRIMERSAQLEGYAQNVAGHLEIDDGATKQQRVAALTQMVSDAASLCPNAGVQAVGLVVSHIEPGYLDDALDHANEEAQVGIEGIQMTSVQSLIQAGLIPPPSSDWMHDGRPVSLRDIAASGDWQDYGNDADGALTGVLRISDIKSEYQDPFRPWKFDEDDVDGN